MEAILVEEPGTTHEKAGVLDASDVHSKESVQRQHEGTKKALMLGAWERSLFKIIQVDPQSPLTPLPKELVNDYFSESNPLIGDPSWDPDFYPIALYAKETKWIARSTRLLIESKLRSAVWKETAQHALDMIENVPDEVLKGKREAYVRRALELIESRPSYYDKTA